VQHYRSLEDVSLHNTWLTIGVFDGVHRGHQEILKRLTAGAHEADAPAVVLTFYPHPGIVLGRRNDLRYLTPPDEKAALLGGLGVDAVITHPFDKNVAALSAQAFMSRVQAHLNVRRLIEGYDFALGRGREGNVTRLTELGELLGYEVQTISPVTNDEEIISSRQIRAHLAAGDVQSAASALGRYYAVTGPVVHGDGRGKKINIPTANLDIPAEKVIPANGVYACWAWLGEEKHPAVTNVGIRPTFTPGTAAPNVETHLLDFNRELYGQAMKLELAARLREEQRFPSAEALSEQIHKDIERAREAFKGAALVRAF